MPGSAAAFASKYVVFPLQAGQCGGTMPDGRTGFDVEVSIRTTMK